MTDEELYNTIQPFRGRDILKIELIDGDYVIGKLKGFTSKYNNDDGEGASIDIKKPPYNTTSFYEYYASEIVSIELYNPEEE